MRKQIVALAAVLCTLAVTLIGMPEASAHHKNEQKVEKILYIPHDNRPISDKQTAEVISKLGYEVVVPPDNMLGSRTIMFLLIVACGFATACSSGGGMVAPAEGAGSSPSANASSLA